MGRLYDKGRETNTLPEGMWWRWEIEYKAESAVALAHAALTAEQPRRFFAQTVATFFRDRFAVAPPIEGRSAIHNWCAEPTSDERLLSWLARGVRPTVARLIERLGQDRVTFSLGLPVRSAVS